MGSGVDARARGARRRHRQRKVSAPADVERNQAAAVDSSPRSDRATPALAGIRRGHGRPWHGGVGRSHEGPGLRPGVTCRCRPKR